MTTISSFRNTSTPRRRRLVRSSSSSRRLSINPDLLHDVNFHLTDEFFARQAPARRHSLSSLTRGVAPPSPLKARSVSERIHLSKSDQAALLETSEVLQSRKQLERLDDVLEEEDCDFDHEFVQEPSPWGHFILVFGLFSGYLISSAALQKLNSLRPGCGQLVTLLQYLATICEKAPHAKQFLYTPVLPMYWHFTFVFLMFISIKLGNLSLAVGLPFGLFLIIKNTNLAWSLLLGLGIGRSFTSTQIFSICIVTAGISICVLAQNQSSDTHDDTQSAVEDSTGGVLFGVVLCAASTFCMASLGSLQEVIFARYKEGQEAAESLFYTHLFGLPLFAFGSDSMREDVHVLLQTPATSLLMLALNIVCTLVVKQCFIELLEEGENVTATLTLTVARMTGVILSELISSFSAEKDSSPSLNFWIGAMLVAAGSLSYATGGKFFSCRRS